jgi:hypothetical protein
MMEVRMARVLLLVQSLFDLAPRTKSARILKKGHATIQLSAISVRYNQVAC